MYQKTFIARDIADVRKIVDNTYRQLSTTVRKRI